MVTEGYKQTEIGVIPEDWEIKTLDEFSKITMGHSPKSIFYNSGEIGLPLIQGNADIKNRKTIIRNYTSEITKIAYVGNLILSVRAPVGETAKVTFDCCIGRGVCSLTDDNGYLYQYLIYFETEWAKFSKGSTFDSITSSEVKNLQIPIPPKQEQQAIATALSDTDALIDALEKLIAKKEAIKIGTMQELLTGKKRLDGFSGEWVENTLGELFEVTAGKDLVKSQYSDKKDNLYQYPIYANSIYNDGIYGYSTFKENSADCITVTARGMLGLAFYRAEPFVAIGRLIILKPRNRLNSYYVTQVINLSLNFANESTSVPQLTAPQISKYKISIPNYEEQQTIATILSDMDKEIEALNSKLSKVKAIKEGMMQELLTGKTRLMQEVS